MQFYGFVIVAELMMMQMMKGGLISGSCLAFAVGKWKNIWPCFSWVFSS